MLSVSACNPFAMKEFTIKQPLKEVCSVKNQKMAEQYGWVMKCDLFNNGTQANVTVRPESNSVGEMILLCKDEGEKTSCKIYHNTLFK